MADERITTDTRSDEEKKQPGNIRPNFIEQEQRKLRSSCLDTALSALQSAQYTTNQSMKIIDAETLIEYADKLETYIKEGKTNNG